MQSDKKKAILKDFMDKTYFLDNNLFTVLNYIKFNILYETTEINNKNIISVLSTKILSNKELKKALIKNIQSQSEGLKDIINEVFLTNAIEINDVDFFEVINSILISNFGKFLLKIIFHLLKQHLLLSILDQDKFDKFKKNSFFNELITEELEKKKFIFVPDLKPSINMNTIIIYNGLEIPESKIYLERICNYINNEISNRYIENEDSLRKKYIEEEEITKAVENYQNEDKQLFDNINVELDRYDYYINIYKKENTFQRVLLNDYLIFYLIKYLEKNANLDYAMNKSLISLLTLIIKLKIKYKEKEKEKSKKVTSI